MILLDSDIKDEEFDFKIPEKQNQLYRIVEKLKEKLPNEIVSKFNKSSFCEEITICFFLCGFDILAYPKFLNKEQIYYIKNITEEKPKKMIFFTNKEGHNFANYKQVILCKLEENGKWQIKKI